MANSTEMAIALSALFGLTLTNVESVSRALMLAGLRAEGGKGRKATRMTGRDTFNLTLALAGSAGMTAAPAFVRNIVDMELRTGLMLQEEQVVWSQSDLPPQGSALRFLKQDLLPGLKVTSTLGDFMGNWIDGMYDADMPWRDEGKAVLEIAQRGQWAKFALDWAGNRLELDFAMPGTDPQATLAWENVMMLRGDLFRKMVDIISG